MKKIISLPFPSDLYTKASALAHKRLTDVSKDHTLLPTSISPELTAWKTLIDALLKSPTPKLYEPLLYEALSHFITLNQKPPCCMMCYGTQKKIAESHYVSRSLLTYVDNYFTEPGSNEIKSAEKMTLKLLCTGDTSACEQTLSKKGEDAFKDEFLPFLTALRNKAKLSSSDSLSLTYGSWLFYNVISLSWRHLLVDLAEKRGWAQATRAIDSERETPVATPAFWALFSDMKDVLLGRPNGQNLSITMYLSEKGLNFPELISEHPIVHLSHVFIHPDGSAVPLVLFGITGCYFAVTPAGDGRHESIKDPHFPKKGFSERIDPMGGTLTITAQGMVLPAVLEDAVDGFSRHQAEQAGRSNPEVIKELMAKQKIGSKVSVGHMALPHTPPKKIIQLPPGLSFSETLSAGDWWSAGALRIDPGKFVLQGFDSRETPCKVVSWLLKSKHENYWCFVMHLKANEEAPDTVMGYQFNMDAIAPNQLAVIRDPSSINFNLTPIKGSDHSLFELSDEGYPKLVLSFLLRDFFDKNHLVSTRYPYKGGQLLENADGLQETSPGLGLLSRDDLQNTLLSIAENDGYREGLYRALHAPAPTQTQFADYVRSQCAKPDWLTKELITMYASIKGESCVVFQKENAESIELSKWCSVTVPGATKTNYFLKVDSVPGHVKRLEYFL